MTTVFRRYLLFQLPDAAAGGLVAMLLVHNEWVSPLVGWLLFALWIGKELALFPLVRRAYEPMSPHGTAALVGERGVVTALPESPGAAGFIRIGAELWRAAPASGGALPPIGTSVCVERVDGYTLLITPEVPETTQRVPLGEETLPGH